MADNRGQPGAGRNHMRGLGSRLVRLALFVALSGLLFYGLLSLVPPQYQSVAQLAVQQDNSRNSEVVASEIGVLKSQQLRRAFIKKSKLLEDPEFNAALSTRGPLQRISILPGLADDPGTLREETPLLRAVGQSIRIKKAEQNNGIRILVRLSSPHQAARLANAYAAHYIDFLNTPSRGAARRSDEQAGLIRLQDKVSAGEAMLAALRKEIKAKPFVKAGEQPTSSEYNGERVNKEQLSDLVSKHILAKADREAAEMRARLVRDMLERTGEINSTTQVLNSGLIQRLLIKRSHMERRVADLSITLLPSHPRLKRLKREMSALQSQIKTQARKAVANLENEAQVAAAREKSLKDSLEKLQRAAASSTGQSGFVNTESAENHDPRLTQLASMELELASDRQKLFVARSRLKSAMLSSGSGKAPKVEATLVKKAVAIDVPVFPRKLPMTLLGMLAALFLGLLKLVFTRKPVAEIREREHHYDMGFAAKPIEVLRTS